MISVELRKANQNDSELISHQRRPGRHPPVVGGDPPSGCPLMTTPADRLGAPPPMGPALRGAPLGTCRYGKYLPMLSTVENIPSRSDDVDPATARVALIAVGDSRARTADRIASPWWYHVGLGVSIAFAFLSMSLRFASFGVPIAGFAMLGLSWALGRATGISVDRYTATSGSRRLSAAYALTLVALAAAGMYLQWGAGVRWAIAVSGVLIGAVTIGMGYRIDEAVRRDLRSGR